MSRDDSSTELDGSCLQMTPILSMDDSCIEQGGPCLWMTPLLSKEGIEQL